MLLKNKNITLPPTGVNFINIQRTALTCADTESAKKDSQVSSVVLRFQDLQA